VKITAARVIVCCPGRNFATLRVGTDEGLTGLGGAPLNGRDAHRIEDIWQYLYKGAYWRRGPVTMSAIAARSMGSAAARRSTSRPMPTCRASTTGRRRST